jgi:hypothetical protein
LVWDTKGHKLVPINIASWFPQRLGGLAYNDIILDHALDYFLYFWRDFVILLICIFVDIQNLSGKAKVSTKNILLSLEKNVPICLYQHVAFVDGASSDSLCFVKYIPD